MCSYLLVDEDFFIAPTEGKGLYCSAQDTNRMSMHLTHWEVSEWVGCFEGFPRFGTLLKGTSAALWKCPDAYGTPCVPNSPASLAAYKDHLPVWASHNQLACRHYPVWHQTHPLLSPLGLCLPASRPGSPPPTPCLRLITMRPLCHPPTPNQGLHLTQRTKAHCLPVLTNKRREQGCNERQKKGKMEKTGERGVIKGQFCFYSHSRSGLRLYSSAEFGLCF